MIHKNMRMREALKAAMRLGCIVKHRNATDDIVIDHHLFPRPIRVKCTRHDTTQQLASTLRKLEEGTLTNPHRIGAPPLASGGRAGAPDEGRRAADP